MVTFSCEVCNETVPKKNTEKRYWRCPNAVYTCIDCSKTFHDGVGYKSHTQCISEDEKYQKGLYRGKNKGKKANNNTNGNKVKGDQVRSEQADSKVEAAQKSKKLETKPAKKITKKTKSSYKDQKSLLKEGTSLYEILKGLKSKKDEKKHLLKSLVVDSSGNIVLREKNSV